MTLTELIQTSNLPKFNSRYFKREFKLARKQTNTFIRVRTRRAKSRSLAAYRSQYYLTTAARDLRSSISLNEDIFIASLISGLIIIFATANIAASFLVSSFQTALEFSDLTGISTTILLAIVIGIITVLCGWLVAFIQNMLSISILDGARRKVHCSVRSTMRTALSRATQVTTAWIILASFIAVPLIIAAAITMWYLTSFSFSEESLLIYAPYAVIAALSWIIVALINYSLMPYVALFEPEISLTKAFGRSRNLVKKKGRIFILLGYVLLAFALFGFFKIAESLQQIFDFHPGLTIFVGVVSLALFSNAMMVTLYRKRKLVRKI